MASMLHEAPLLLLRREPNLLAALLERAAVPATRAAIARIADADFSQAVPIERRADAVVTHERNGRVVEAFVIEAQRWMDPRKKFAWPLYLASLHARLRCPCRLVVLTPSRRVARWAEQPIDSFQPGSRFAVTVLGPSRIPLMRTHADAASSPELAMLSALVHAHEPDGERAMLVALAATRRLDAERAEIYADLLASLRQSLERKGKAMPLFDYEFKSPIMKRFAAERAAMLAKAEREGLAKGERQGLAKGERQGLAKGERQGLAKGLATGKQEFLLELLAARKIKLSREGRARILACRNARQLKTWLTRALSATSEDELWPRVGSRRTPQSGR